MKLDLYRTQREAETTVRKIKNDKNLSERNKEIIFEFQRHCVLTNLSQKWTVKCLTYMRLIALKLNKDFDKVTKKALDLLVRDKWFKDRFIKKADKLEVG